MKISYSGEIYSNREKFRNETSKTNIKIETKGMEKDISVAWSGKGPVRVFLRGYHCRNNRVVEERRAIPGGWAERRAAIHGRTNSTTTLRCVHRAALTLITHLGFRAAGMHTRMFARIIGRLYMCPGITPQRGTIRSKFNLPLGQPIGPIKIYAVYL